MPVKKKVLKPSPSKLEIVPVKELPAILAMLAYGRSGTGKTTFASTFPKPLLLVDVRERGTDSISNVDGVDVVRVDKWEQFEELYWYLTNGESVPYRSVVIDHVTALQEIALDKVRRDEGKDHMSQRLFGMASGLLKTWFMNYRDLIDSGIHVVFLAHDRVSKGEEDEGDDRIDPNIGAALMPSVATFLNGLVKIIGNTFIREAYTIQNKRRVVSVEYAMRIGPHAYYTTKVRSPVGVESPAVVVDPTYDKLVAVMRGKYREATESKRK